MFEAYPELKPPTVLQLIGWWELRRIPYNLIILIAGFATLFGIDEVVGPHIPPGQDVIEPLALVFVVIPRLFLIANAGYTLCWIGVIAARSFQREKTTGIRSRAFWGFTLLSCLVISLPFWWVCIYWIGKPVVP